MKDFPVLHTQRCVLNRITDEDIPVMRQIFKDVLTQKYLPELRSLVRTDKGIRQILQSFDFYLSKDEGVIWAIRLSDALIGFVAIMDLSSKPTVFYALHPDFRKNGYMQESVAMSVQYILEKGLNYYVQTEVHNENMNSINLLQSIGFRVVKKTKCKTFLQKDSQHH